MDVPLTYHEDYDLGTGRGAFPAGVPRGICIHYTAGGDNIGGITGTLKKNGLGYHVVIQRDGKCIKLLPLDQRCDHAGPAFWNGISPNRECLAIALANYGLLQKKGDKFFAWPAGYSREIPNDRVIIAPDIRDVEQPWEAAPKPQLDALYCLLKKLMKKFNIKPQMIFGHDEAARPKGRKVDPGGILGKTMDEVRDELSGGNV